jgi:hypothetical protein
MKAYNFGADEKQKPNGTVEYEIVKNGANTPVFPALSEPLASIPGASTSQVTLEKLLPLSKLEPGQYTLRIKVTDNITKQTLTPNVSFTVN